MNTGKSDDDHSNQNARDVNATPLIVSPRTASCSDSVRGLSIRVIESVPTQYGCKFL